MKHTITLPLSASSPRVAPLRPCLLAGIILITATWAWNNGSASGAEPGRDSLSSESEFPQIDPRLGSSSAKERREALLALTDEVPAAGESILPRIWPLLQDSDPLVRLQAARAVWIVGHRSDAAVETLTTLLDRQQVPVCALAAFLLGEIGPPAHDALPRLHEQLASNDSLLRLHAAEAIVKIDATDTAAHRTLIKAQQSDSPDERYFAACALLYAGPRFRDDVRSALLASLADEDLRIASAAALSLEDWPAGRTAEEASSTTGSSESETTRLFSNLGDENVALRRQAALRLSQVTAVTPAQRRALQQRLADEDPLVRAYIARTIWHVDQRPEAIVPALIDLLGTLHPNVTTLATSVLAEIGPQAADALPALTDLLDTGDPMLQLHVAIALSRVDPRSRDAVSLLTQALHNRDSDRRYLAALSLGHVSILSRRQAERELTKSLRDRNLRVRAAAARSLTNLQIASAEARARASHWEEPPIAPVAHLSPGNRQQAIDVSRATMPTDEANAPEAEPEVLDETAPAESSEEEAAVSEASEDTLAAIPVLQDPLDAGPQPPAEPPQQGVKKQYDVDEETVEERKGINQLRARITPSEGDLPLDHAKPHFAVQPMYYHGYGMSRGWWNTSFAWEPPGVCHAPLYFQDLNLERYGYHYGCFQTVVSTARFAADVALLPYKVAAQSPCDCVYTLGYDRPGNCVPYRCYRLPWRTDAFLVLGGVATGLIFLAP